MIEVGKNYYYVGIGISGLLNKIVKVLDDTGEKFGSNRDMPIYLCEDENLNTYRVMEISLSKTPAMYRFVSATEASILPEGVATFPTFKDNKYICEYTW